MRIEDVSQTQLRALADVGYLSLPRYLELTNDKIRTGKLLLEPSIRPELPRGPGHDEECFYS